MAKKIQEETSLAVSKFSLKAFSDFVNANFSIIILLIMAFLLGFLTGSLWRENRMLKNGIGTGGTAAVDPTAAEAAAKKKLENLPAFDAKTDHFRGNKNAKVVLVEYSDYECPYCNKFHPTMVDLMEKYGDQIAWVYRHFPLSFHPNAQPLAEASECVATYGSQDAFWKFSDSVYAKMADGSIFGTDSTNKIVSEEMILSLATAAGADASKVKACLDSDEMAQAVKDDQAGGSKAGVSGTPGTVIVSKKGGFELIPGALPIEQIETLLEKHL
jgi:protein-disulfide isomerase